MKALNKLYRTYPALYQLDDHPDGFQWMDCTSGQDNIVSFVRKTGKPEETLLVVCNFAPVQHDDYQVGVPFHGKYKEIFNSESKAFGGCGVVNPRVKTSKAEECRGRGESIQIQLAPLGVQIYTCTPVEEEKKAAVSKKTETKKTETKKTATAEKAAPAEVKKEKKAGKAAAAKEKKEEKEEKIRESVSLAAQIQDRSQQVFALAGILAFSDKLIDMETANKIRRMIEMTKVGWIIEQEKQEAIAKVEEALVKAEEEKQQAARESVIKMIRKNYPTEEIAFIVSSFSQDEIETVRREIAETE